MHCLKLLSVAIGLASLSLLLHFPTWSRIGSGVANLPCASSRMCPEIVARKLERKSDIEWSRYSDLTASDLGELVGVPKMGRTLHKLVHQFPKLELSAHIQPITRSMLRIELTLLPDFQYDIKVHGYVQLFHVIVEDVNGENILYHEMFSLKSSEADNEHSIVFTVPIMDPTPSIVLHSRIIGPLVTFRVGTARVLQ